jgi:hypothetical protein
MNAHVKKWISGYVAEHLPNEQANIETCQQDMIAARNKLGTNTSNERYRSILREINRREHDMHQHVGKAKMLESLAFCCI